MTAPISEMRAHVVSGRSGSTKRGESPAWLLPAVVVVSILPIWTAVVGSGLRRSFPHSDAATTVNRARDVFDGPFPLVGMQAAAATSGDHFAYFPGAWQLYAIAVPTQMFGNVWGPPLAMALLHSVWVALTAWLLFRRLHPGEAVLGTALVAVLLWSLGSGFLVTPVPMDMVVVPTALFLVAVWSVADGDLTAIPVLAVIGNFLWLSHLVLVLTVPVVGLCAPIGLWMWLRRMRAIDLVGHPLRRRRMLRSLAVAAAVTVIMWLPPLVQQLVDDPGNLRVLVSSAGADRPDIGSWPTAIHNVISVVVRPPFWFRGTLDAPSFLRGPIGPKLVGELDVFDVAAGAVVVGAIVVLAVVARWRRDHTGYSLLVVSAVALALAVVSTYSAPSHFGPPTGYLRSLWPTAMFVWFALLINVVRAVGPRVRWSLVVPGAAALVSFTALNLPAVDANEDEHLQRVIGQMNAPVLERVRGAGTVELSAGVGFATHELHASLALALRSAGVAYCVPRAQAGGLDRHRICPDEVDRRVTVVVSARPDRHSSRDELLRASLLDADERADHDQLARRVDAWVDAQERLELSATARERLRAEPDSPVKQQLLGLIDASPLQADESEWRTRFRGLVSYWYASNIDESAELFTDAPLDRDEWRRWLDLSERRLTVVVTESRTT